MRILLATDGSDYSKAVVEELASRPLPANTEVGIISAFISSSSLMSTPAPPGGAKSYYEEVMLIDRETAEKAVKEASGYLRKANSDLIVTTSVAEGIPHRVILNKAEEMDTDLIILGSHGRGGIKRLLLGSVSQTVAQRAKCSVLIVRKSTTQKRNKHQKHDQNYISH